MRLISVDDGTNKIQVVNCTEGYLGPGGKLVKKTEAVTFNHRTIKRGRKTAKKSKPRVTTIVGNGNLGGKGAIIAGMKGNTICLTDDGWVPLGTETVTTNNLPAGAVTDCQGQARRIAKGHLPT